MTKVEIKERIIELSTQKTIAIQKKDRKKIRKINAEIQMLINAYISKDK